MSPSPTRTEPSAADQAAITETIANITAAWNAGDAAAYAAQFTPDATYVAFNGEVMRGRGAIEDVHRWLFDGPLRSSRLGGSTEQAAPPDVRMIAPGVAHVVTGGGVTLAGQPALTPDRASVVSLLLVADPSAGWQVAAFHNTRRQP